jgi:uroporphyrinogen decarboxylase
MRQAGRSLPEYRALRAGTAMLQACQDPDLVTEITLQPVRRHGVDAAILFSDIVLPLVVAGRRHRDQPGVGPVVASRCARSPTSTRCPAWSPTGWTSSATAVRRLVAELGPTPLIGFAGAPFTLATYLIEGGPSKEHARTKAFMYAEPEAWTRLLERLAVSAATFLRVQVDNGASAVQLFDSWAGVLSAADYAARVLPHSPRGLRRLGDRGRGERDVPRVHFGVGTGELLPLLGDAGADVVGVDWRVPLDEAARRVGPQRSLQGNLDPAVLLADRETVDREVRRVVEQGRAARGHVFNLGHGVLPETDPGVLTHVVELVHELSSDDPPGRRRRRDHRPDRRLRLVAAAPGRRDRRPGGRRPGRRQARPGRAGRALVRHRAPRRCWRGFPRRCSWSSGSGWPTGSSPRPPRRPRWCCPTAGTRCRPAPCSASRPRPTGWTGSSPRTAWPGWPPRPACRRSTLDGDVAVGALLRERLGDEVVDRLVEPLLGGVYAGAGRRAVPRRDDAAAGRAPAHRGVRARCGGGRPRRRRAQPLRPDAPVFVTVADGIGSLPAALVAASGADVRLRTPAHGLTRTATGFELSVGRANAPGRLTADAVLVTAPAPKAARLLSGSRPAAVEPLQGIPYASMAVVAMAFPAQEVAAGSGLLVPPVTGRLVKGVTVSSRKWPHLAGEHLLVRSSVGRYRDERELQRADDDLAAAVVADVADLLGCPGPEPVATRVVRWGGGLPQYLVGPPGPGGRRACRGQRVPGLAVAGAAFRGVGVPACIRDAQHAVDALL